MRFSPETLTSSFQSSVPHSSVAARQAPVIQRETVSILRIGKEIFKQNEGCIQTTHNRRWVYQEQSQTWAGNVFPPLERIPTLEKKTEIKVTFYKEA